MCHVLRIFDALELLPESLAATRVELELGTGLVRKQVLEALRALARRGDLMVVQGGERARSRYRLRPGAARPLDERGRYARNRDHRALQTTRRLVRLGLACQLPHRAAMPPAHTYAAGAARPGHSTRVRLADVPRALTLADLAKWGIR